MPVGSVFDGSYSVSSAKLGRGLWRAAMGCLDLVTWKDRRRYHAEARNDWDQIGMGDCWCIQIIFMISAWEEENRLGIFLGEYLVESLSCWFFMQLYSIRPTLTPSSAVFSIIVSSQIIRPDPIDKSLVINDLWPEAQSAAAATGLGSCIQRQHASNRINASLTIWAEKTRNVTPCNIFGDWKSLDMMII